MSQCDKHLFYYFHFQFLKYFPLSVTLYSRILEGSHKVTANVMWLALSGVAPTPSHYKYNKTFHSAADFPKENPEVAIEANRC